MQTQYLVVEQRRKKENNHFERERDHNGNQLRREDHGASYRESNKVNN